MKIFCLISSSYFIDLDNAYVFYGYNGLYVAIAAFVAFDEVIPAPSVVEFPVL